MFVWNDRPTRGPSISAGIAVASSLWGRSAPLVGRRAAGRCVRRREPTPVVITRGLNGSLLRFRTSVKLAQALYPSMASGPHRMCCH